MTGSVVILIIVVVLIAGTSGAGTIILKMSILSSGPAVPLLPVLVTAPAATVARGLRRFSFSCHWLPLFCVGSTQFPGGKAQCRCDDLVHIVIFILAQPATKYHI